MAHPSPVVTQALSIRFQPLLVRQIVGVTELGRPDDGDSETSLELNAGSTPAMAPLHKQTWESFSRNVP